MEIVQLYQLFSLLDKAQTTDELKPICAEFCKLVNTPHYLLGMISHGSLYAPDIKILTNYPDEWMEIYLQKNKKKSDPVVSYMLSKNTPIFWDVLLTQDQFKSSEQQLLMQQASQFGLVNGLSVPIHSVSGDIAVLSLAVDVAGEEGSKVLEAALPFAHLFASHLFERFLVVLSKDLDVEAPVSLTERERQCLFWACEGKTSWEMSQILDIKERTVIFHLNNSTKKLGAINRQHAVVMATKKGLIHPNL